MTRLVLTFRADQRPMFEALRQHLGARSMSAGIAQLAAATLEAAKPVGLAAGLGHHGPRDRTATPERP